MENTAKTPEKLENDEGMLRSLVTLGSNLTETTVETVFGTANDLRVNSLQRVRSVVDWVETIQQSNIALARKLTDRTDTLSAALVTTGERALRTLVHATRESGHGMADVTARTAGAFVSKQPDAKALS